MSSKGICRFSLVLLLPFVRCYSCSHLHMVISALCFPMDVPTYTWPFPVCCYSPFVAIPHPSLFLVHCCSPITTPYPSFLLCCYSLHVATLVVAPSFSKVPLGPLLVVAPTCPLLFLTRVSLDGTPPPLFAFCK